MAKIQIKSERLTPFGGLFSIMEQFDSTMHSMLKKHDKQPLKNRVFAKGRLAARKYAIFQHFF